MARLPGDPSPGQRLRYVFGGKLPEPQRDWVRHDLTDAGWRWRLVGRVALQLLVPAVICLVVPGINALDRALLVALLYGGMLTTIPAMAEQVRDRRLRQHGLPVPEKVPDEDEEWRNRHHRY